MVDMFFDNPPVLSGKPEEQLVQLKNYLFTISNKLNDAFMEVSIQEKNAEEQQAVSTAGGGQAGVTETNNDYLKAKELIIKTAEAVRTEMQEIQLTLEGSVQAISDQFGTYEENLVNTIRVTAEGILEELEITERIETVEQDADTVLRKVKQFIFSGIVDEVTQEAGIAIGYDVVDEEGNLNRNNQMAVFKADRLSFYKNGIEVSYFSNDVFYIAKGEVTDSLKIGNFQWKKFSNGSVGLMKN